MYINDVHILIYVVVGLAGLVVGQLIDWANKRLPEYKKVFSKEIFTQYFRNFTPNYLLMCINALMYLGVLYTFRVSIDLFEYLILVPLLLSAFCIDLKLQIIPNRLNLSIFEVGLLFTFIKVIASTNLGIATLTDSILGMLVGGGIFLFINLIGGLIAGKEAMGFGDVKLMAGLGLFFGWINIIIVSVLAFLLAAIISIGILIIKRKKVNEYIPFGPFIVASCFVVIFTPFDLLLTVILKIFTLGMYQGIK
ncbi:MAG: prepilin peptidase [Clostridia bacterium]|nr:prepilin peptidase [Clostridia bacterium]